MRIPAMLVAPLCLGTPLAAQSADLAGVYFEDPIRVTLQLGHAGWVGLLEVAAENVDLEGLTETQPGVLTGGYQADGRRFDVRLYRQGPTLSLEAEGMQVFLPRVGEAPALPGSGPAATPAPATAAPAAPAPAINNPPLMPRKALR